MSEHVFKHDTRTPSRPRCWQYVRRLCIAVVLTLAIVNATLTPPVRAEGTFEAPKIVTTVLILAVAFTAMLSPFRDVMSPPASQRPAAYNWHTLQIAQAALTAQLIFATIAPILLMYKLRQRYGAAAPLMLTTAILLTQPFAVPPSVTYSN